MGPGLPLLERCLTWRARRREGAAAARAQVDAGVLDGSIRCLEGDTPGQDSFSQDCMPSLGGPAGFWVPSAQFSSYGSGNHPGVSQSSWNSCFACGRSLNYCTAVAGSPNATDQFSLYRGLCLTDSVPRGTAINMRAYVAQPSCTLQSRLCCLVWFMCATPDVILQATRWQQPCSRLQTQTAAS